MTYRLLISILQVAGNIDTHITLAINSLHNGYWDTFMYMYSDKYVWLTFYLSFAFVIFRFYRWSVGAKFFIAAILLLIIDDQICSSILRSWIARLRPSNLDNPISQYIHIVAGHRGGRYGCPSAHACNTFGLAFFLLYCFRRHLLSSTALFWAALTCYSRIYLGVHYFGDCLLGMILGGVNATVIYCVFKYFLKNTAALLKPHPQLNDPPLFIPVIVCWTVIFTFMLLAINVRPC